jgi:hypothetical protein
MELASLLNIAKIALTLGLSGATLYFSWIADGEHHSKV